MRSDGYFRSLALGTICASESGSEECPGEPLDYSRHNMILVINGNAGIDQMKKHIGAEVNGILRVNQLPKELRRASWKDGGLSYSSLVIRRRVF
jgi:hypothetical protein